MCLGKIYLRRLRNDNFFRDFKADKLTMVIPGKIFIENNNKEFGDIGDKNTLTSEMNVVSV